MFLSSNNEAVQGFQKSEDQQDTQTDTTQHIEGTLHSKSALEFL